MQERESSNRIKCRADRSPGEVLAIINLSAAEAGDTASYKAGPKGYLSLLRMLQGNPYIPPRPSYAFVSGYKFCMYEQALSGVHKP